MSEATVDNRFRWSEKNCVVTGAANGLGLALSTSFADRGCCGVALVDKDPDVVQRAEELEAASGIEAVGIVSDLSTADGVDDAISASVDALGSVEVFVGNAGIASSGGVEVDDESWALSWEINVMAHVRALRRLVPTWGAVGGGTYVLVASAAGLLTQLGAAPYTATKHAAVGLGEWANMTYAADGVVVHTVCPQGIETRLLDGTHGLDDNAVSAVRNAGDVISTEDAAETIALAIEHGELFVLTHPVVSRYEVGRAKDHNKWLAAMTGRDR